MKNVSLTIVLLVAAFLFFDSQAIAQDVISLNCPSTAAMSGQEEALRSITKKYLIALQSKDWGGVSKSSATLLTGFNLTQILMQDLLEPLKIESSDFEIHEASAKPCEASVSYTLSLKAADLQTQKRVIEVTGLRRIAHWRRFQCECPPTNATQWMLVRDVADVGDLVSAVSAAKTAQEQSLLLLAMADDKLNELAVLLARKGYELLDQGRDPEATKMFRLNRAVLRQVRHHNSIWNLQHAKGLEKTLAEAEKNNDQNSRSALLNSLGEVYLRLGEQGKSLKFFEDSLRFPVADGEVVASAYSNIGKIYRYRGDYPRAIDNFLKSLERYKSIARGEPAGDSVKEELLDVTFNLAFVHEAMGHGDLAQNRYGELLSTVEKGGDEEAVFLLLLGCVQVVKGNVAQAIAYLERSSTILALSTSEDKATLSMTVSSLLVEPYLRRNDYAHAATHLVRAREGLNEATDEGFILLIESMLYGSQGDKELALSRTKRGFAMIASKILGRVGEDHNSTDDRLEEDSNPFLPNLLALYAVGNVLGSVLEDKDENDLFNVPSVLNAAALEHLMRGGKENLAAARKWFFHVLTEAEGDDLLIAQTHERIAGVYHREKNYAAALDHYQQSLKLIESARLSLTFRLTEFEPTTIGVWRNIARIHVATGDYEQALVSYRKILDRSGRFYRLLDTTLLYEVAEINFKLGRYEDALATVSKGLSAAASGGDRDLLWKLHTLAGRSQHALKQDAAASRSFADAIREIETSRSDVVGGSRIRERFFEDKLRPYHEMIAMLVEQGRCAEALAYAERSKSRVLLDTLNHRNFGASRTHSAAQRDQERRLRSRMINADRQFVMAQVEPVNSALVSQLREKRLEARLEYDAFRIGLQLPRSASDTSLNAQAGVIDLSETLALLPPTGGALLEFVVTSDKTYLFVITEGVGKVGERLASTSRAQCTVHSIAISAAELNQRAAILNSRIANSEGIVQPRARELYDLLLKPAQAALAGKNVLVVVPDRYLWTLPFQALQQNDGRYLLQESAIYYAPSLTSLREMRKTRAGSAVRAKRVRGISTETPVSIENPKLLIMANPTGDLSPLPMTESQAPRIAQLYGPGRSKVYVRADADEGRFKKEAQGFDVIHLGAHGLFDDGDPMYSRVVLARNAKRVGNPVSTLPTAAAEPSEDGLLEAWEIMDLELNANLVVLSACETARGRVGDGEGIIGLTWALFMASVPSTVVSQWKVDEEATTELMYLFHENLVKNTTTDSMRANKAEALRQASLKLIESRKYRHPYYWAGFVLIGNGN